MKASILLIAVLCGLASMARAEETKPVAAWKEGVSLRPVSPTPGRHTLHSYYLCNPESPDGKYVVFFASTHLAAYVGNVVIVNRATGEETVLAENVHTEDAHRAACQQWLSNGKRVAFHEVVDGRWRVVSVDVATKEKTIVAEDRQAGFGRADGDLLPMYGCHWNPKDRDLEIWNAATGETETVVTIEEVEKNYGDWLKIQFGGKPTSIFFPILSPDSKRVFFKMAAGNGGDNYMAKDASNRQGTVAINLETRKFWMREKWGHPAWYPDSRYILEMGNIVFDTDGEPYTRIPNLPNLRGSHPSVSPDGTLMVTDGLSDVIGGKPNDWGIMVGDIRGGDYALLYSGSEGRGARSWRKNHPHPIFSADNRRVYFNVNSGEFTQLYVAERSK